MQKGEYIADRLLPKLVKLACERQNVAFQSFSGDWVLRLQKDNEQHWVIGPKFDLNQSAAGLIAQDKVAMYQVLAAAELPAVKHVLVRPVPDQSLPKTEALAAALGTEDVVVKPLTGTGGHGVKRCGSIDATLTYVKSSSEPAWAVSPFEEISHEYRLVVLGGHLLLAYEKTQPTLEDNLKFFNLGKGAYARDIEPDRPLETLALQAVRASGLRLAVVDVIAAKDGLKIIEINDGLSMEYYARQSAENRARAAAVYDSVVESMFL